MNVVARLYCDVFLQIYATVVDMDDTRGIQSIWDYPNMVICCMQLEVDTPLRYDPRYNLAYLPLFALCTEVQYLTMLIADTERL